MNLNEAIDTLKESGFLVEFGPGIVPMNDSPETRLMKYLKKHLTLKMEETNVAGYDDDPSYTVYTFSLELDGEKIGESQSINIPM